MKFTALLALVLFLQDEKADGLREYDIDVIVQGRESHPAPALGDLHGQDASDSEPEDGPYAAIDSDTLIHYLTSTCTPDVWGDESTMEIGANGHLFVTAPAASHKEVAAALQALRARLVPEIAIDAMLMEITLPALTDLLSGGASPSVLSDERTLRLQQLIKEGTDIRHVRRLRLTARNTQRVSESSLETTTYVADADLDRSVDPPVWRAVTAQLKTGVTFDVRPSLVEGGLFLSCAWQDARIEKIESFDAGGRTLQMPLVRRLSSRAEVLIPNTATAFAGAGALADRPGWLLATFLRPQLDPKLPQLEKEPALLRAYGFAFAARGGNPEDSDVVADLSVLMRRTVEPDSWDEDAGRTVESMGQLLFVHHNDAAVKLCRTWLAERARALFIPIAIEARLLKTAGISQTEPLSARDIEKLGKDATVLWQGVASCAQRQPIVIDDLRRRPIVADYNDKDPVIQVAQWGVRFAARATYDAAENLIHVTQLDLRWSSAADPMATAPHPAAKEALLHTPKIASHDFRVTPTLTPGEWSVQGIGASGDDSIVLLVRATVQK
jgi:hypothetical protein